VQTTKHIGGKRFALRSRIGLVNEAGELRDAHLFTFGEWRGHPSGPFEFTEEVAQKLIANFEAQANPVPFTYEHEYQAGMPRPASGWVQSLEIRDNGLWAKVEWTKRAREMIREGEYKYCSVVVDFEGIDRRTGEDIGPELVEVGLTNTPFVDGQEPLAASRALNKGARMADGIDKEEVKDEMKLEDSAEVTAASMLLTKLTEATGMDEAALIAAVEAKLDELVSVLGAPVESEAVSASDKPSDEVAKLSKENADLRCQLVTAEVARAVELGHVPAGQKDMLIKLGRDNIEAARALIDGGKKSAKVPPQGQLYKFSRDAADPNGLAKTDEERRFLEAIPARVNKEQRVLMLSQFRNKRTQ
jgi:phage I-like protein